ncbi:MAG TPA: DUF1684 domain-containing protein [Thermoanaerobaculia bacterium]|nr:DUF1684 domain-containing protein [Thermoanaerobaculia bacterium]
MKRLAAISLLLACVACHVEKKPAFDAAAHANDIRKWQKTRAERLQAEDGWLSLVGLYWLHEGENHFGSDKSKNDMVFPQNAPPQAGTFTMQNGHVVMSAAVPMTIDGKPVTAPVPLIDDANGGQSPTVVQLGTMRFQVIKRGDRYGIRVKDPASAARTHFVGLDYFPIDPKWRIEARYEPYNPPKKIPITNVLGMTSEEISPGALVFEIDGKEVRLDPILEEGETDLFLILKDQTSRDSTYPAGRYLYATPPAKGSNTVIVDFNKAYNPPCAFTDFATCPLPPMQNRLPFRIEAGEKKYRGGHA